MKDFEIISLILTNEPLATSLVSTLDSIDDELQVLNMLQDVSKDDERQNRINKLEIKKKVLLSIKYYYYKFKESNNILTSAKLIKEFRTLILSI